VNNIIVKSASVFLTSKDEIKLWLKAMEIKNYNINEDLTVDVNQSVSLYNKNLPFLPIQFGQVSEDFNCSLNPLNSLKGAPFEVGNNFTSIHNGLKSLDFAPLKVHGHFDCSNNLLTTLDSLNSTIDGELNCSCNKIQFTHYQKINAARFYHRCLTEEGKIELFATCYKRGFSGSKILDLSMAEFEEKMIPLEKDYFLNQVSEKEIKISMLNKL
jgi:hypothetical protein